MTVQPSQDASQQPDPQYIVRALTDELARVNDNRLWLLSMLAQKDAQLVSQASRLSQLTAQVEGTQPVDEPATD